MAEIEIVSATRLSEEEFRERSALGRSLKRLEFDSWIVPRVAFNNARGLPEIFNPHIQTGPADNVLVFIHDDVFIEDHFFVDHVLDGLKQFDVLGVAGNLKRRPNQPSWNFIDEQFNWDDPANLSGRVGHGKEPFGEVALYGPAPRECELLDGVFLAAKRSTLQAKGVAFDPRFRFHFYDMDFCRTARQKGLRLGTWLLSLTHQSGGAFGTPDWQKTRALYREKWGD